MNCREMLQLVDVLASEKNVAKDTVFGVLEAALASAVKKAQFPGEDADVVVHVDRVTGEFKAARRWLVVADEEGLQEPDRQEMYSDVIDEYPEIQPGEFIEREIEVIDVDTTAAASLRTPSRSSFSACVTPNASRSSRSSSIATKAS